MISSMLSEVGYDFFSSDPCHLFIYLGKIGRQLITNRFNVGDPFSIRYFHKQV